jgi:hypothetical protein
MPETVFCHYQFPTPARAAFVELLNEHWPTLRRLELVTDSPVEHWIGSPQRSDDTLIIEIFEWSSAEAAGVAHSHPEVAKIWDGMGAICTDMSFPHLERLAGE